MTRKFISLFLFVILSILSVQSIATTYETIGNNSWIPSTPSNSWSSNDVFIINHFVTLNGFRLLNGGSITINSGGKLTMKWSANFDAGTSIYVASGGELKLTQLTTENSSSNFVIEGTINTSNGSFINETSGVIDFKTGAVWTFNQQSLTNKGS